MRPTCLHKSTSTHPHIHTNRKSYTHQHYAAHTYKQGKVHAHSHYKAIFLYRGKINEYVVTRSSKIHTCAYMDSNSHIVIHTQSYTVTYTYTGMPAHRIQRVWYMERNKQNRGDRGRWQRQDTHNYKCTHMHTRMCTHGHMVKSIPYASEISLQAKIDKLVVMSNGEGDDLSHICVRKPVWTKIFKFW